MMFSYASEKEYDAFEEIGIYDIETVIEKDSIVIKVYLYVKNVNVDYLIYIIHKQ